MIPYGKQQIDIGDVDAVSKVFEGDFLTTGPKVKEFEDNVCKFVGCKYAIAVSSGTAALHLACLAAGLKKGEELITSPMTFAASANCALYCNANPVFVDVNENGLIDENKIENKITKKSKIIIPIHYTGLSCEMEKIKKIADKNKLIIIEDACHALGAKYKNTKIGDCKYSNMAVFSFHPVKHITTGEGGMITTNSKEFYEKLISLRNHGMEKKPDKAPWYYEISELGYNYRITDIQCALGVNQLKKLKKFIIKRREIANKYNHAFKNNEDIEILNENVDQFNVYHLYIIKLKNKEMRLKLFSYLKEKEIFCQIHYIPVYWHPYYKKLGYNQGLCSRAEEFYEKIISLPMYPELNNELQDYVIKNILDFFS